MDEDLQKVYDRYMDLTADLSEEFSPLAIAGVMVAQAMSIYRTTMSEEDYEAITANIYELRNKVKKFELPRLQ